MVDAATKTTLVSGSVWSRTKDGETTDSIVLFITNEGMSEKVLRTNPQQVVFLSPNRQVLSMTPEQFCTNRKFKSMDQNVEAILEALTQEDMADEEDDAIDIDSISLDDPQGTGADDDAPINLDGGDDVAPPTQLTVSSTDAIGMNFNMIGTKPAFELDFAHPKKAELMRSFISYAEGPSPFKAGDTQCVLRFNVSPSLTLDDLRAAFGTTDPAAIAVFFINSTLERTRVEVDYFVEVFLEVSSFGAGGVGVAAVYIACDGDLRARQLEASSPSVTVSSTAPITISTDNPVSIQAAGAPEVATTGFVQVAEGTFTPTVVIEA